MMPSLLRGIVVGWKEDLVEDKEVVGLQRLSRVPGCQESKVVGVPAGKRTKVVIYQESHPVSLFTEGGPVGRQRLLANTS